MKNKNLYDKIMENSVIVYNNKINDYCLEWNMSKNQDGYGKVFYNNKTLSVHIEVYFYNNPNKARDGAVHHSCHNRACVKISHLFLTTHDQNLVESLRVKYLEKEIKTLKNIIKELKNV
jgi:hypothetical protein